MKRAVGDLATFPDDRLFNVVSEGLPSIIGNSVSLDETAQLLHRQRQYRAAGIMRGFAEEEAAKALILFDLIRCPPVTERRRETARRFYSHVAKRIHAMACAYPAIVTFGELCEMVETESRPYYLDGPNSVDWIFPNSISDEREQALYVDYVQELTDKSGECYWRTPVPLLSAPGEYETPDCVRLGRALSEVGAATPEGLAVIADIWRDFMPGPQTGRSQLRGLIADTLDQLGGDGGSGMTSDPAGELVIRHWPFPLWPLIIREPRGKEQDLEELRERRARAVEWIEATESKRDSPPAISRSQVEALSEAYAAWEREVAERSDADGAGQGDSLRIRTSASTAGVLELPSYLRLGEMFRNLTEVERAALLALGWFARERIADWPRIYERANGGVSTIGDRYQIGQGGYWLAGLERWEQASQPFEAGRWNRL